MLLLAIPNYGTSRRCCVNSDAAPRLQLERRLSAVPCAPGVSTSYLAFGRDGDLEAAESRSPATVIEEQERQALEIAALSRRVNTLEDRGGGDPLRTAPE